MKYLLIARDKSLADAWKAFFHDQGNVDVVQGDLCAQACDAVVNPANSFGFGFDSAQPTAFDIKSALPTVFDIE